jgi:hypothetical protein
MRFRLTVFLVGIAFLGTAVPALESSATDAEALIGRARAVLLTPHPPREAITKALADALEAALLILPKTDYEAEFRGRVEGVKKTFNEGALFSEKAYQDLAQAYKLTTGGKAWQIPAELKSPAPGKKGIEKATEVCAKLLDSALAEKKAGRDETAVSYLLDFVLLVVTPVEA